MNFDSNAILQLTREFMQDKDYRDVVYGTPYFVPQGSKHSKEPLDYWVAPIVYTVFQEEDAFLYIADHSGQVMYLLTGHGRSYINGIADPVPEDDDDDDWDDL